jgi:hypothetical protein
MKNLLVVVLLASLAFYFSCCNTGSSKASNEFETFVLNKAYEDYRSKMTYDEFVAKTNSPEFKMDFEIKRDSLKKVFPVEIAKIAKKSKEEVAKIFGEPTKVESAILSETSFPADKCIYLKDLVEIVFINEKADWITVNNNPQFVTIGNKADYQSVETDVDYVFVKAITK